MATTKPKTKKLVYEQSKVAVKQSGELLRPKGRSFLHR